MFVKSIFSILHNFYINSQLQDREKALCLWFVWGFTLYQQYLVYLMATVHKSCFLDYF